MASRLFEEASVEKGLDGTKTRISLASGTGHVSDADTAAAGSSSSLFLPGVVQNDATMSLKTSHNGFPNGLVVQERVEGKVVNDEGQTGIPEEELTVADVLCYKQGGNIYSEGNKKFQALVKEHAAEYASTATGYKIEVAKKVVDT